MNGLATGPSSVSFLNLMTVKSIFNYDIIPCAHSLAWGMPDYTQKGMIRSCGSLSLIVLGEYKDAL